MEVIVIHSEAFQKLHEDLMQELRQTLQEANQLSTSDSSSDWIDTNKAKHLLGVKSKSKMQELRDQGAIRFSQHGRIIKYSKKSIIQFLEKHSR